MNSEERVLAALAFNRPDRIPVFDSFWQYPPDWQARFGPADALTDVERFVPDETPFPSRARLLKQEDGWIYEADSWGRTVRRRADAFFVETLDVALGPDADIDAVQFESPVLDSRYCGSATKAEFDRWLRGRTDTHYVFIKTGGPFLRTTFVRGETQFLIDMAADPALARAIAGKVAGHIAAIGVEALRRTGLGANGVWIYDDMACNRGPFFSPRTFEQVLLPAYRRMIAAYRAAGARHVLLHSDGDVRPILDMLIDAGIDGLNPLERRAGMDILDMRRRYPRLVLTGGMDNTGTLIAGPIAAIESEARAIIDIGRDGGVIIGTHSISPEIPVEHFAAYRRVVEAYGVLS